MLSGDRLKLICGIVSLVIGLVLIGISLGVDTGYRNALLVGFGIAAVLGGIAAVYKWLQGRQAKRLIKYNV